MADRRSESGSPFWDWISENRTHPKWLKCSQSNLTFLKRNSHQILFSEMSLPGIEVLIEKLLPQILGRLGMENTSKGQCEGPFVQRKWAVTCQLRYDICTLRTAGQVKISVCTQGSCECCSAWARSPEPFVLRQSVMPPSAM